MNILAAALALSLAAGENDLPRSLSEELPAIQNPRNGALEGWSFGGHLGFATAYDSDDAAFLIGGQGRVGLLPWLALEVAVDFQTGQEYEHNDIEISVIDFQVSALFYPDVRWPVRPYGVAGIGLYLFDVEYSGALSARNDDTDAERGFHLGAGADSDLNDRLYLSGDLRFVFPREPGSLSGNDVDYLQLTFGLNWKLGR